MRTQFCSLASGSTGNSQYIGTEHVKLLVDAGVSGRYIKNALHHIGTDISEISAVLVTHEHSDHIKGLGVLMRKYDVDVYINELTWHEVKKVIGEVNEDKVHIFQTGKSFDIQDMHISPIEISHDAVEPVAFCINTSHANVCIATDMGIINDEMNEKIKECDFLMIEANHDENMLKMGNYPYHLKRRILGEYGHLSNETAGNKVLETLRRGRLSQVILGHLSRENNFPHLAYETVNQILLSEGVEVSREINIDVAHPNKAGKLYRLKNR